MKKLLLATMITVACPAAFADVNLEDENEKLSYSLGLLLGDRFTKRFGDINYDAVIEGLQQAHEGKETAITIEEAQNTLQAFEQQAAVASSAEAKAAGTAFLAENKARDGVQVTESGLQYEVLTAAEGPKPEKSDTVSVHYVGTLIGGKEFDSSIARGQPAEFPLANVIPGWTEGLQLMNVGSKFRFVIPSDLAYGPRGAGQDIGPDETLVFEVELLEIK